jgi:phosphatidylinositol alpha 1,6-mannosyltransferase
VCRQLVGHYEEARMLRPIDDALLQRGRTRPSAPVSVTPSEPAWTRFVALGDSLTEGLCDASRMPEGAHRGWADRLAELLAHSTGGREPFRYANLAVRSRRVRDLTTDQLPRAVALRPDLVSVLMGANDLVARRVDVAALASELEGAVRVLRATGADVLLVTPFLPRRRASLLFARRFARFASELRRIASSTGAVLLDLEALPAIGELDLWADDKVHLRSRGHRFLAYRAADALGVAHAEALGGLDAALHADEDPAVSGSWLRRHALPWVWRRVRGRTAGDGLEPKHAEYVVVPGRDDRAGREGDQRRRYSDSGLPGLP